MYTTVLPRRWSKKEVELLCSCGTDCTYGAWPWGPTVTQGFPSHSSSRRQACAAKLPQWLQGGRGRSRRIHFFLSSSALPLFLTLPFCFPQACPHLGRYAQLGILHPSDLEPLTEEGLPAPTRRACHYSNGSPINSVCHNTQCIETGLISSDLGLPCTGHLLLFGFPRPPEVVRLHMQHDI